MRRLHFALLALLSAALFCCQGANAQPSTTVFGPVQLTAACTNSTTTCDGTANSQLKFGVGEYAVAGVTIKGTFTGATLSFEFSDDGGTSWFPTTCTRNDAAVQELSEAVADSTNRSWDCGVSAARTYRIRLAAISTGGPTVTATLSSVQIEPAPTVSQSLSNTQFAVTSNPAAGSQASASQSAAAGLRNVATEICFSAGSTTAPALTALTVNLRNGASGAGTVIGTWQIVISNATGQNVVPFCTAIPNITGSVNTAMTLEFSAGLANLIESVTLYGYTSP